MFIRVALTTSLLAAAVLLAACGGGTDTQAESVNQDAETQLTILAVNPNVGRAVFNLSCGPAGGDVPSPERACESLEQAPDLLTNPRPFICAGGTYSWWSIEIRGHLHGAIVNSQTASCWTPQMDLIERLGIAQSLEAHLVPRRHEELVGGEERKIAAGSLLPGDLVVCLTDGRRLEQGVPTEAEVPAETGYDGLDVKTVSLRVTRHRDGTVSARCT